MKQPQPLKETLKYIPIFRSIQKCYVTVQLLSLFLVNAKSWKKYG